jgi:hypothetical protein
MQDSDSSKNIQLSFLSGSDLTFSPIISTALHEPIISNSSKTQSTASSQIINITSSNASPVLVPPADDILKAVPSPNSDSNTNVSNFVPSTTMMQEGTVSALNNTSCPTLESKLVYWSSSTLLNNSDALKHFGIKLVGVDSTDTATLGALVQPLLPFSQPLLSTNREVPQCAVCCAYINSYCDPDFATGMWRCIFCNHSNKTDVYRQNSAKAEYVELTSHSFEVVKEIAPTFEANMPNDIEKSTVSSNSTRTYIILVDMTLSQHEMKNIKFGVLNALKQLDDTTRVGLITYSNIVSIYNLASSGVAAAYTFCGIVSPPSDFLATIIQRLSQFLVPLRDCLGNLESILDSLAALAPPSELRHPTAVAKAKRQSAVQQSPEESLKEAKEMRSDQILSSLVIKQQTLQQREHRALGVAIEVALTLLEATTAAFFPTVNDVAAIAQSGSNYRRPYTNGGQLLVMLGGIPNYGPGQVPKDANFSDIKMKEDYRTEQAIDYYKRLSLRALENNIEIDIFCGGLKNFQVKILQNLAMGCGGSLTLHKEFATEFFNNIRLCITKSIGYDGLFSLRHSRTLTVTHLIGPAVELRPPLSNRQRQRLQHQARIYEIDSKDTAKWCRMTSVQRNTTFAIYYEVTEDIADERVYFQFTVKFVNFLGQLVTRIITCMLCVTNNWQTFLASINPEVVSVLIAKKCALTARRISNLEVVFEIIDNVLYEILDYYRTKEKGVSVIPVNISKIFKLMYLLRRSVMLGPILQHPDDIDYVRCLFIFAPFEDCMRLLEPKLLAVTTQHEFSLVELPLEDLALQSKHILILDHHTDIFIWSGLDMAGPEFDLLRQRCIHYAIDISMQRYPQPHIRVFTEGDSNARWLECRLIPSHKDPIEEQLKSFPQLRELSQERQRLLSKFHRTDEMSFYQYYRTLLKLK